MAYDEKSGKHAIYQYAPDLIICDYNMPVLSGGDLHKEITTSPELKEIPFIFVSAVTTENIIFKSKKQGAVAYLANLLIKWNY